MTIAIARRPRIVWPRCLSCRAQLAAEWEGQDGPARCGACGAGNGPGDADCAGAI